MLGMDKRVQTDAATSERLGRVRQRGTGAELAVRRMLHALGSRFRVDNRDLPGSPDVANRTKGWAIFVHGCFWHSHANCSRATIPRHNRAFWKDKLSANVKRDQLVVRSLRSQSFRVLIIWECELLNAPKATARIRRFLRALGY